MRAKDLKPQDAGKHKAAVAVVVPTIEAAARSLLRALTEGISHVQVERDLGGYPGLWTLLTELERLALDEDWAWFLRSLLLHATPARARLRLRRRGLTPAR
jgi:hypothetical protein